jgi:two-component system OmpR family response regulator
MNSGQLRSVLYVDDEPDIREIVRISLGLSKTLTVHTADSGEHALTLARALLPDLVLLDVMMPGLDGPATLSRMRLDPIISPIPVIFMTAKAMPKEVALLREMGAAGVIGKPFDPMQLGTQVISLWQGRPLPVAVSVPVVVALTEDDSAGLRRQVTQFAAKFLRRTRDEAERLHGLIDRIEPGDATAMAELEQLAHRIHGSGSTFGFAAVSECAAEIEQLIGGLKQRDTWAGTAIDAQTRLRLSECTHRLAREVEAAAVH